MPAPEMKSTRMEAFSDGVIAVILTIMVLELHVPQDAGLPGFLHVTPRLGIYALSFLMIAIYWINHHEICGRIEVVNYRVLWSNLFFLFCSSLIPFFTDYVAEHHFDSFSTALYSVTMLLSGAAFFLLRLSVDALRCARGENIPRSNWKEAMKHAGSLLLYLAAVPVAYYRPLFALGLNLIVTLIWITPEAGMRRSHEDESSPRA